MQGVKFFRLIFPFILALVITYMARRPVKFLEKRRINRSFAIILIYLMLLIAVAVIVILMAPGMYSNVSEIVKEMPKIYEKYKDVADMALKFLSVENAMKSLETFVAIVFDGFLSFVIAFYFLRDRDIIKEFFLTFFPVKYRKDASLEIHEVNRIISTFVTGQLLVAFIIGALETLALMIIGIKYPFVLGFFGGISNIVPVIGPVIGAIPAVAVGFIESPYKAVITAAAFIIVQQIDNNFLTPRIVEGRLGLHPVVTISVVFIAGIFWGVTGIIISIPVTAVIVSIIKRIYNVIIREKHGDKTEEA